MGVVVRFESTVTVIDENNEVRVEPIRESNGVFYDSLSNLCIEDHSSIDLEQEGDEEAHGSSQHLGSSSVWAEGHGSKNASLLSMLSMSLPSFEYNHSERSERSTGSSLGEEDSIAPQPAKQEVPALHESVSELDNSMSFSHLDTSNSPVK